MKKLFLLLLYLILLPLWGQTDSLAHPKIGLVLSGGGAKGLAHIGVLKALEAHGIRPDYIGGTSMGAIVGSLYAMGYSAQQIDSLMHRIAFDDVLYNRLERKYKSSFEKERGKRFIISFPFSLQKMSVQLPRGLSNSQGMFNVLAENMQPARNISDFSRLKIPFFCISTDIVTGKQVLFNKGYLPATVTASALLPSVYKPIDMGGKLLLDGGIVNNYPVKEVRDLGSDFVIGSDVQGGILSKEEITDMAAILDQIISFGMYKEMPLKKAQTDLYIHPDITGIGLTDFEKIDTIIARGQKAAEKELAKFPDLKKWHTTQPVMPLHYKKPDSLLFNQIIIHGQQNYDRDYILGKIGVRPKQKISYQDFLDGIQNLTGSGNFEKIYYRFTDKNGGTVLQLDLKEQRQNATVNLGFHYNDLYNINVIVNFTNKHVFAKNDLLSAEIIGGKYFRYNFDYIIDNGFRLTWGLHSSLHRFGYRVNASDLFAEEHYNINKLDFNFLQFQNKIYFQGNLNHFINLRVGLQHQYKKLFTYVFSSQEDEAFYFGKNHYFGNYASLNFDSRDDCNFPTKGLYFKLKWQYFWSSSDFYRDFSPYSLYTLNFRWTQKIFKNWLLQPLILSGLHFSTNFTYDNIFYLGGMNRYADYDQLVPFEALPVLSIAATKYSAFGLNSVFKVYKNHFIDAGGHLLFYDKSNDLLPEHSKSLYGFHIGYGIKSFLGPFKVNFGRIPAWQRNYFNFSFGYNF